MTYASENPERDAIFDKWGIRPEHYQIPQVKPAEEPKAAEPAAPAAPAGPAIGTQIADGLREGFATVARTMAPPPAPVAAPEIKLDDIVPPDDVIEKGAVAVAQFVSTETARRMTAYADARAQQAQQMGAAQAVQAIEGAKLAAATAPTWSALPPGVQAGIHNQLMQTHPQYAQADFAGKLAIAEAATRDFVATIAPKAGAGASTVESTVGGGGGARPSASERTVNGSSQEAQARQLVQQYGMKR